MSTPRITPKGEARRDALQDAVVRVLERGGPGAVTHRAVAAEAGVPVAAATYYFATLDDLLVSALLRTAESQAALFASVSTGAHDGAPGRAASLRELATLLYEWTHTERSSAIAQYELFFLAMRRDALRAAAEQWYSALEGAVAAAGYAERASTIALAIDGLLLRMLWRGESESIDGIEATLTEIVGAPQHPRSPA
ncbi:TetR/AcrR family transcriptional regulator [Marisediminicola senii]|uniref:TetR/AcrR family transcriptional regulator n=1 Tax=Marisediminicola senii TaxID=2711233 RepID=UPI0013EAD99F|nr:TetR family transcriptional regulator [Marisediminicola senii]